MDAKFTKCHDVTAKWEGGWSNHPADPGGKTMYGITEARWHEYQRKNKVPMTPVRSVTKEEAVKFYFTEFWIPSGGPTLFEGVDLAVYDAGVNSGVSRGRKWLSESLDPNNKHDQTVKNICQKRLSFMRSLAIWNTFGKGWSNRVADIQAKGVAWALAAMGKSSKQIKDQLASEAAEAKTKSTRDSVGAAGSVVTGGGAEVNRQVTTDPGLLSNGWFIAAIVVAALATAAILLVRAHVHAKQAQAFEKEIANV